MAKIDRPTTPRPCRCGCGEMTKGGEFRIGHDARHKSNLINEALSGTNPDAVEELEQRGWTKFLEKRKEVVARPSRPKREVKAEQELDDVEKARKAWDGIALMKVAGRILERRGQYHRGPDQIVMSGPEMCVAIIEGADERLLLPVTVTDYDEINITSREREALERHRHMMVDGSPIQAWLSGTASLV